MKSDLLKRLSREKPAHKADEISEALKLGYSVKQIVKAMNSELTQTEIRQGKIWYAGPKGRFDVPYTYETFQIFCRLLFE